MHCHITGRFVTSSCLPPSSAPICELWTSDCTPSLSSTVYHFVFLIVCCRGHVQQHFSLIWMDGVAHAASRFCCRLLLLHVGVGHVWASKLSTRRGRTRGSYHSLGFCSMFRSCRSASTCTLASPHHVYCNRRDKSMRRFAASPDLIELRCGLVPPLLLHHRLLSFWIVEKVRGRTLLTLHLIYFGGWDLHLAPIACQSNRLPSFMLEIVSWVILPSSLLERTCELWCFAVLEKRMYEPCRLLQVSCSWVMGLLFCRHYWRERASCGSLLC
jgi:hypothetical protein